VKKILILCVACAMGFFVATAHAQIFPDIEKITGPWLWITAPTPACGAAGTTTDWMAEASGGAVTEADIAANGANEGDTIGDKAWTLGEISPTGGDNINELVNAIGLGAGDVNNTVAYGVITVTSAVAQDAKMYVGSDDAIKVWLNGEVVWENPINRGAGDFQEGFDVSLKAGGNLLMGAVYECGGGWSGFFGINADFEAAGKQYVGVEPPPEPGDKITGPWLWVTAPTPQCGADAVNSGIDWMAEASAGAVTEADVAKNGAREGAAVGSSAWTLGEIPPTGSDNINELVNAIGLGSGDVNNTVAYGFIWVFSDSLQETKMYVGSDDAIKVWLNGDVVWENPVNRGASDYQENFDVTLNPGANALMVAVYECGGGWSGFFGLAEGVKFDVVASVAPAGKLISTWGSLKNR